MFVYNTVVLTRSRNTLKQQQVRIGNRIRKVLEDANGKLSSVMRMSDVIGVSYDMILVRTRKRDDQ
ncbi:MAG TPA: hypothetical protein VM715_10560, partial [Candidatus Acidoferrum sp.]|nr:hypothetical protein [Candidatus Acidoferrum sp.]